MQGSGWCPSCDGVGMVTPVVEETDRRSLTKSLTKSHDAGSRKTQAGLGLDLHVHGLRGPVAAENSRRSCLSPAEASRGSVFSP